MATPSRSKGRASKKSLTAPPPRGKRIRSTTLDASSELLGYGYDDRPFPENTPAKGHNFPHEESLTEASTAPTVPKALVKFIIALFLLPCAWVLTETFLQAFTLSLHHGLLATQTFGCFAAGGVLFGILYLLVPQKALMIPYVLGHEVTHAIWAWIFGGRVANHFHVSPEGGHVLTDRVNTWIVLAPYFFPIYSVLVVTIYGAASLVANLTPFRWLLFLLLGVTLTFHLFFTFLLIVKGQPDLHYGGTFFSLMVIYLINLLVVTGLLLLTGRHVSLITFSHLLMNNTMDFIDFLRGVTAWVMDWIGSFRSAASAA